MIDKSALLARRLGEADHEIDGVGTVRIRSLSVLDVRAVQALVGDDSAQERCMISRALVDPPLTEDEVKTWQEGAGLGEINGLILAITELSGLGVGAPKSGVPGVRE